VGGKGEDQEEQFIQYSRVVRKYIEKASSFFIQKNVGKKVERDEKR
jgi:hypothetical protein